MKINLVKLARLIGHFAVAVPAMVSAVRPILKELKSPKVDVPAAGVDPAQPARPRPSG